METNAIETISGRGKTNALFIVTHPPQTPQGVSSGHYLPAECSSPPRSFPRRRQTPTQMALFLHQNYTGFFGPFPASNPLFCPIAWKNSPSRFLKSPRATTVAIPTVLDHAHFSLATPRASTPDEYAHFLERCASRKALSEGQQLHARILTSGVRSHDGFLDTKLLFMYGKCGSFCAARKLFEGMPRRSIFAWNGLIGAYVSAERFSEALELYRELRVSGETLPDACTLVSVLKACGALGNVACGMETHGLGIKCGEGSTGFFLNALLSMYSKCGRFDEVRLLFDGIPEKSDVVTWNAVIWASLQQGECSSALDLFREMINSGLYMNSYTVVGILQACTELSLLKIGKEIHASLLKSNEEYGIFEANALLVMYARCGRMHEAVSIFHGMPEKDNVTWNSLLSGYVQNELYTDALNIFLEMQDIGMYPDQVSIISIASSLGRLGKLTVGKELHAYALKQELDTDLLVGNTLMDMYTKCFYLDYAARVFHRMACKDRISWTTAMAGYAQNGLYLKALHLFREAQREGLVADSMMVGSIFLACSGLVCVKYLKETHGYAIRHGLLDRLLQNSVVDVYGECGEVEYAMRVFDRIENKDVISWSSMINCHIQNGLLKEAFDMFRLMQEASVELDEVALCNILSAAAELSSAKKGKEVHGFLVRKGFSLAGPIIVSLVEMYARCGNLGSCLKVFDKVPEKDLAAWTAAINAYGMHGQGKKAVSLFHKMLDSGLVPDHVSFMTLLYACGHSGLADEGLMLLDLMKTKYQLELWPEHYACVVDLLGRSGRIDEAYDFVTNMSIEPTAPVWCALLGACRIHSNYKVGEISAQRLMELEPENPGNYILISNVFTAAGKQDISEKVRSKMKELGLKKDPGCTWIEIGNKVHSFVARDNSHPDSEKIYLKLDEITQLLERHFGYEGDTGLVLHDVGDEEKLKMLYGHSERLAIAYGLISNPDGRPIHITKNLRVCGDCHQFTKLVSKLFQRQIVVRDANRFHHFKDGACSCRDFW